MNEQTIKRIDRYAELTEQDFEEAVIDLLLVGLTVCEEGIGVEEKETEEIDLTPRLVFIP